MKMNFSRGDGGSLSHLWKFRRGGGGHQFPAKMENPGGWGVLSEIPSVVGVWIFSGTTHCRFMFQQTSSIHLSHLYVHYVFYRILPDTIKLKWDLPFLLQFLDMCPVSPHP